MAYVHTIDPTDPSASTGKVKDGAAEFQNLKAALIERINTFFTDIDDDPWAALAITIDGGTVVSNLPLTSGTQTWNNGAASFIADFISITDTASLPASYLAYWQVAGVPVFVVSKAGLVVGLGGVTAGVRQSGALSYLAIGDGTANEATWGLSPITAILGISSALTSTNTSGPKVHAHLLSRQSVATSGSMQGLETWTWASHTSGTVAGLYGLIGNTAMSGVGGTVTNVFCLLGGCVVSGGTVTNLYGVLGGLGTIDGASSVVTNGYGMHIATPTISNSGILTNLWGLYIQNMQGAGTLNYAIYTNNGIVRFGDQLQLAAGTAAHSSQRMAAGVAPTSPVAGDIWNDGTYLQVWAGLIAGNGPLGYGTGNGGTITQATNKSTGVTLDKVCGTITTANESVAVGSSKTFVLTNAFIAATDMIRVIHKAGGTLGAYVISANKILAGSCQITIYNPGANGGGTLSEVIDLTFVVFKAVNS